MSTKRVLRFYFAADRLNRSLDNLIFKCAIDAGHGSSDTIVYADRIIDIIQAKRNLSLLWGYLNAVMQKLSDDDEAVLMAYAVMRMGIKGLEESERKNIRRAVAKFSRRAERGIDLYDGALKLVDAYYCLM